MRQQAWNICRGGRVIDTVYYDMGCDSEYVLAAESNHYSGNITVRKG